MNHLHLETDASLNPARQRDGFCFAGAGIVLRDGATLSPVASYWHSVGYVASSEVAEGLALLSGLEVARRRHNATSLVVRIDCMSLKKQLGRDLADLPIPTAEVVRRLREEIARFERVEIRWGPTTRKRQRRDGQPTADALARKAAGLGGRGGGP